MRQMPRITRRQFLGAVGGTAVLATTPVWLRSGVLPIRSGDKQDATPETATSQWAMIIDLRKCDGCESYSPGQAQCTLACQRAHLLSEDQTWIRVFEMEEPGGGTYYMPRPCYQCENAPCVNVCPVAATYRNEEGVILVDQSRCIGCRFCMAACPYAARYFNWDDPPQLPQGVFSKPSPEYPVPQRRGTVGKCVLCAHNSRDGKLTACGEACPMNAIYLTDLTKDLATNGIEVIQASEFMAENHAYRYKEELGTRPRVYYIPGHGQEYGRSAGGES